MARRRSSIARTRTTRTPGGSGRGRWRTMAARCTSSGLLLVLAWSRPRRRSSSGCHVSRSTTVSTRSGPARCASSKATRPPNDQPPRCNRPSGSSGRYRSASASTVVASTPPNDSRARTVRSPAKGAANSAYGRTDPLPGWTRTSGARPGEPSASVDRARPRHSSSRRNVGCSSQAPTAMERWVARLARAIATIAVMESPPRSKKSLSSPGSSTPRTSSQIAASRRPRSVVGAAYGRRAASGASSASLRPCRSPFRASRRQQQARSAPWRWGAPCVATRRQRVRVRTPPAVRRGRSPPRRRGRPRSPPARRGVPAP